MNAIMDWFFERIENCRIGWNALMYEFGWKALLIGSSTDWDD